VKSGTVKVTLVFADHGAFHREQIEIPAAALERYDTLVDCLREDAEVLERTHLDASRLCAAFVTERS
jgi:hypothetical protein